MLRSARTVISGQFWRLNDVGPKNQRSSWSRYLFFLLESGTLVQQAIEIERITDMKEYKIHQSIKHHDWQLTAFPAGATELVLRTKDPTTGHRGTVCLFLAWDDPEDFDHWSTELRCFTKRAQGETGDQAPASAEAEVWGALQAKRQRFIARRAVMHIWSFYKKALFPPRRRLLTGSNDRRTGSPSERLGVADTRCATCSGRRRQRSATQSGQPKRTRR